MELTKTVWQGIGVIGVASSIAGLSFMPVSKLGSVIFSMVGIGLCTLSIVGLSGVCGYESQAETKTGSC